MRDTHRGEKEYFIAPPLLLQFKFQTNDFPAITEVRDVQASECLAVLSLALICQAVMTERKDYAEYGLDPEITETRLQTLITDLTQEATESIGLAERAADREAHQKAQTELNQRRARLGGHAKNQDVPAFRELVLQTYWRDYAHRRMCVMKARWHLVFRIDYGVDGIQNETDLFTRPIRQEFSGAIRHIFDRSFRARSAT